mgnify:FL=1
MARFIPFILKTDDEQKIGVRITRMKKADAAQTEKEPVWQTSWMSAYIQKDAFEKYDAIVFVGAAAIAVRSIAPLSER